MLLLAACNSSDWNFSDPDEEELARVVIEEQFLQSPSPKLDVLFVVDGTGSMAEEQTAFASAAEAFVARLDNIGLSWQLGVTSTDPADGGALLGEPWILTPGTPDVGATFAANVQVGTDRAPPSAGLYTAMLTIEDSSGVNVGFPRADAPLHIVFVSDGDDDSDTWLGEDPVAASTEAFSASASQRGFALRASAVVGQTADQCVGTYGVALLGARYIEVAEATGGALVDICEADFSAVADAVEAYGVEWPTTFSLQTTPDEGSVTVSVDGARQSSGWSVEGSTLSFDEAPVPGAEIEVRYEVSGA